MLLCCVCGFSLIEVIVVLLLLVIIFIVLMKVVGGVIGLIQYVVQCSEVVMWVCSLFDSVFVIELLCLGISSGMFNKQYCWQLQVMLWNFGGKFVLNVVLQLYQFDLDVCWNGVGYDQVVYFSMLCVGVFVVVVFGVVL